jgi:Holliday junction DNA helicase RuvA
VIASLFGRLQRKLPDHIVVDVGGVGYSVHVPLSTYNGLPEAGAEVSLAIHTHVREDTLQLFGFLTEAEKEMFLLLMSVSGIGPRLALTILSSMQVSELLGVMQAEDQERLCRIPGIGKKTAGRIVLELKDKLKKFAASPSAGVSVLEHTGPVDDAVSALVNLGYKKSSAEETVASVSKARPGAGIEQLLRESLGLLTKRG